MWPTEARRAIGSIAEPYDPRTDQKADLRAQFVIHRCAGSEPVNILTVKIETFATRAHGATGNVIINPPKLPSWKAFARLAAGLACLMLGIVGSVVWASVTTNM